ncbi:hypothetical protein [Cryptosporangium minutisporangium]|uniref:VOC domain-containing protein n=1 Tax=Cryptosporangium minutisporangium TaxID=113569 RepID=A0ABP6T797_9ACTN
MFVDDPDALLNAAAAAGADYHDPVQNHRRLWGTHRQGGFSDPFGHFRLVWIEHGLDRRQRPVRSHPNTRS